MQVACQIRITNPDKFLFDTICIANEACNDCIRIGFENRDYNKTRLHHLTYYPTRKKFPTLNSSIVTSIRDQASDMLKRVFKDSKPTKPIKRNGSGIRLTHNTFKVFLETKTISISTIGGRREYQISVPEYFMKKYLVSATKLTAATLRAKRRIIYLDVIAEVNVPTERPVSTIIGIDRGAYFPAVASNNMFFDAKRIRKTKGEYRFNKQQLQRAGTRSAKRHLKQLAGRERRFIADVNHCISKRIVGSDCDAIALEELKPSAMKMRKRRGKGRKIASLLGSWSPTDLLNKITYKAALAGKKVILVNSHYTSQACNRCGDIRRANRNGRNFKCQVCDFTLHSDLNASRNIASLAKGREGRLHVNQPIATYDELKASLRDELRASIVASPTF
jgi:IS605 OrfB family transposase